MDELITTNADDEQNYVNVTVHTNALSSKVASYAKVNRKRATLENIIALAHKNNPLLSETILRSAASEFKIAIQDKLEQGFAVNVFDLGTLFLTAHGGVNAENPTTDDIPSLGLCFTPSSIAKKSIARIAVYKTTVANTNPHITKICDTFTGKADGTANVGKVLEVYGERLKIVGEETKTGVYFAPCLSNGTIDTNEARWKRILHLSKNFPKLLSFYVPDELTGGTWFMVIRTSFTHGNRAIKSIHETVSEEIKVVKD